MSPSLLSARKAEILTSFHVLDHWDFKEILSLSVLDQQDSWFISKEGFCMLEFLNTLTSNTSALARSYWELDHQTGIFSSSLQSFNVEGEVFNGKLLNHIFPTNYHPWKDKWSKQNYSKSHYDAVKCISLLVNIFTNVQFSRKPKS